MSGGRRDTRGLNRWGTVGCFVLLMTLAVPIGWLLGPPISSGERAKMAARREALQGHVTGYRCERPAVRAAGAEASPDEVRAFLSTSLPCVEDETAFSDATVGHATVGPSDRTRGPDATMFYLGPSRVVTLEEAERRTARCPPIAPVLARIAGSRTLCARSIDLPSVEGVYREIEGGQVAIWTRFGEVVAMHVQRAWRRGDMDQALTILEDAIALLHDGRRGAVGTAYAGFGFSYAFEAEAALVELYSVILYAPLSFDERALARHRGVLTALLRTSPTPGEHLRVYPLQIARLLNTEAYEVRVAEFVSFRPLCETGDETAVCLRRYANVDVTSDEVEIPYWLLNRRAGRLIQRAQARRDWRAEELKLVAMSRRSEVELAMLIALLQIASERDQCPTGETPVPLLGAPPAVAYPAHGRSFALDPPAPTVGHADVPPRGLRFTCPGIAFEDRTNQRGELAP